MVIRSHDIVVRTCHTAIIIFMSGTGDTKPIVGYWNIRGRAQVIRLLFSYIGQDFESKVYKAPEDWFGGDRTKIGLDFTNLPYLIDGNFKLTETNAILRYIANSYGHNEVLGKNVKDSAMVDQIIGVLDDMSSVAMNLAFNPNF